jgi:hypothetical protein
MNFTHNDITNESAVHRTYTDTEILTILPEAKQIVPALIKEINRKRREIVRLIGNELVAIKAESSNVIYRHFWRLWLLLNEGEELQIIDGKLFRLNRLLRLIKGIPSVKSVIDYDLIEAARQVPINSIFGLMFKRSGINLVGYCPFHNERTPSFYIYVKQNKAHCFGCDITLDVIEAYKLLNDCDFKTAVHTLSGANL